MWEFQVGDRVRVLVSESLYGSPNEVGALGTVAAAVEPGEREVGVSIDGQHPGGDWNFFLPEHLEIVVPTPARPSRLLDRAEVRITSETGGQKGKKLASVSSLDPKSLLILAEVSGLGAQKYDQHNYLRGYDWSLSFDAAQRHLLAFWAGEGIDPESGQPHLAHAAWHCLALLSFQNRDLGTDDRFDQAS